MYIVHVHITVKPGYFEQFLCATLENARASLLEPGIVRFDVIRELDKQDKFVLVEIYHSLEDALQHKETSHYLTWRDSVAEMMAVPREGIKYANVIPVDADWR